ncbi:hypothetical protein MASR1M107_13650 [Ignavibacteriales bacterium]
MKLMKLATILLLTATMVFAQGVKVPKEVTASFKKLYPSAKTVEWKKNGKTEFEAKFKENGKAMTVNFASNGSVVETEAEINFSELPKSVDTYIAGNFKDYKKIEAIKITDSKGSVTFETKLSKGKNSIELLFDKGGKFLKKTA